MIFTFLVDLNAEPIAKTPKPGFPFWPRKRHPSYTYFDCSRRGQTNFIRCAARYAVRARADEIATRVSKP